MQGVGGEASFGDHARGLETPPHGFNDIFTAGRGSAGIERTDRKSRRLCRASENGQQTGTTKKDQQTGTPKKDRSNPSIRGVMALASASAGVPPLWAGPAGPAAGPGRRGGDADMD